MANKTTKKHFEIFKIEAGYWIRRFGLLDWEISYAYGCFNNDNLAEIAVNTTARSAIIRLAKEWIDYRPITEKAIRRYAFHEVCHLLTVTFDSSHDEWDSQDKEIKNDSEIHGFIQRMLNAVWEVENADEK